MRLIKMMATAYLPEVAVLGAVGTDKMSPRERGNEIPRLLSS